jgi:anthranilate synthase component 2
MNLLVLDNYDSFTYNLVQYIQEILGRKIDVYRNDAIALEAVDAYDVIV